MHYSRWHTPAILLILAAASVHVVYLASKCPLDLAPDEAHYWDWSRHLDWSYYSKGPLVAYLIRAGCGIAGTWSQQLTGSAMLAVRLPAVLCGGFLLGSIYILSLQVFGRPSLALATLALAVTLPVVTAGALLMTIDAPFTCCWGWALVLGHRAVFRGSSWAWPALGLVLGLGILAKYTMVLWVVSLILFLLWTPSQRKLLRRPAFWIMLAVAGACSLPIVGWNIQHDWVSLRHVIGQAGFGRQPRVLWLGPLEYVGVQFGLLLGFWFVAWAAAMVAYRPWRETDIGVRYLWWMSAPVFVTFLLFSLKTREEPNWPVTAYLSGLVLATGWLAKQLQSSLGWYRRLTIYSGATACSLGIAVSVGMHHSDWFQPLLLRLSGAPTAEHPLPLRRFDPTCRLRGWRFFAAEVDRVLDELRDAGIEPLLAASSWTVPGELGFYCRGNPAVYSLGLALGDRHSQYDLWRPNPLADETSFRGRTFVFIGEMQPAVCDAFLAVDTSRLIEYREQGQPVAQWTLTVCRCYLGFRHLPEFGGRSF
jgi:hypothetical protein